MPLTDVESEKWTQIKEKLKNNPLLIERAEQILISINSECLDLRAEVQGRFNGS